jgi:BirA family biotin operon repressor/biotin-[acetyl-CoA-carboxylase] ligase
METLFVGRNLIFLPQTDSTNSYAISLLKNVNIIEGSVICTDHQTGGKGQRGNVWHSEKGKNITASFVLKPDYLNIGEQYLLYQITSLACHDLLAEILLNSQVDLKIKWPNDILANGKKICGILIENLIGGNSISFSVVGIGLNVNQTNFKGEPNAVSMQILAGKNFERKEVLELLCSKIEMYYLLLKSSKISRINDLYMKKFYGREEWKDFEVKNVKQSLKVKGISEKGLLLLENKEGKLQEFDVKEIKWL